MVCQFLRELSEHLQQSLLDMHPGRELAVCLQEVLQTSLPLSCAEL